MTRGRTSDGRRRFSTVLALALVAAVARVGAAAPSARSEVPPPTTAVVFGATGDLAKRKVFPALLAAWRSGKLPRDFQIVAAARDGLGRDEFLARLRTGMKEVAGLDVAGDAAWAELEKRIAYREVDLASLESVKAFGQDLDQIDAESGRQRLLYLAITPSVLGTAADHLGRAGILASRHGRGPPLVLVEKPFGRDAKSARRLNRALASHISLGMVMRMDHYLGKPAIEDLRRLRASDPAFGAVWNRDFVSRVEISASEKIGIEGRGSFYEETGALRDFAQGHLLQALAVTAMEPATGGGIERAKADLVGGLRRLSPDRDVVRGQYEGYRQEPGVAEDSVVETYVAISAQVENERWRGVPFLLESGKQLAEKRSTIRIHFRRLTPELARRYRMRADRPATLEVEIDPRPSITLTSGGRRVAVVDSSTARPDAYERLLVGAMRGERGLFVGAQEIERAWAWLEPVQRSWRVRRQRVATYARGVARPSPAEELFASATARSSRSRRKAIPARLAAAKKANAVRLPSGLRRSPRALRGLASDSLARRRLGKSPAPRGRPRRGPR